VPAYYANTVFGFLRDSANAILGQLASGYSNSGYSDLDSGQIQAWVIELEILKSAAAGFESTWGVLLEFPIPRRQRRIDAVLIARDVVVVLEFKGGVSDQTIAAAEQVEDYALDLAEFHEPSNGRVIIPIVVAPQPLTFSHRGSHLNVEPVLSASADTLRQIILEAFHRYSLQSVEAIDVEKWNDGAYRPVPSVIEAATALYAGMSVREITHSHAGIHNLSVTTQRVLEIVKGACEKNEKVICFVTGVPGAGKTLAGLNTVHDPDIRGDGRPASVFMSGNGPLVDILRDALAVDCAVRTGRSKDSARREVRTFIQNIHHFVEDNFEKQRSDPPYEHAIVFDEAQGAWNADQNRWKYRKKSGRWHIPEPQMVLDIMDRHSDWAVIVALVGGGQEIHAGEAGLGEWGRVLGASFQHWRIVTSPEAIEGGESVAGSVLFETVPPTLDISLDPALHLNVCVRSHRARLLAEWVNRLLNGQHELASELAATFTTFPLRLTRDLSAARNWLKESTGGLRRCGLVGSSGAARLRAYGLETSKAIRDAYSYPHWFLAPRGDVRSSYQLETLATEFEIQGLELDYVSLCWGGDFVWSDRDRRWHISEFKGARWNVPHNPVRQEFTRNKYRVLLTRAREGMVIWIPEGDPTDPTRSVTSMNETAEYLVKCGVKPLVNTESALKG
jgi:hypothetical protein